MQLTSGHCFAGGGGDTEGAVRANYTPLWAIESDYYAAAVYRKRFPECQVIESNVRELSDDFIRTLPTPDLFVWGSPCPDFSLAGKRAGINGDRGCLFYQGLRFLRLLQVPYFIFENVEGILSSSSHPGRFHAARIIQRYQAGGWGISAQTYQVALQLKKFYKGSDFKQILWEFGKVGYRCTWQIRNGNRWIPQNRPRVFVVGRHRQYPVPQD